MKYSESKWTEHNLKKVEKSYPRWPIEVMVKVIFGNYLADGPIEINSETKVLDIGCGFGNNLIPFLEANCDCHGVEITQEMADLAKNLLKKNGYGKITTSAGNNREIPYGDNFFDIVISNNVIHYEGNEEDINKAIKEYRRILKPDGVLYLMTVGPEHDIYRLAKHIGNNIFQIQNWDFRNGENYFYFSDIKILEYYLGKQFNHMQFGRIRENLMKVNLDSFIAVCRK